MYHCHIQFYLIGRQRGIFDPIKESVPPENFTFSFAESDTPEAALASQADVIFADLEGLDAVDVLRTLAPHRKKNGELIFFASREQTQLLLEAPEENTDIWAAPVSGKEVRFRFAKWLQGYKRDRDLWQTEQFWRTAIDSTPNMIWYKTKDGIHEVVNASFCKIAGKAREDIEGYTHAHIWNVEVDDPACIESDRAAMGRRGTSIAEEALHTGDGVRKLNTYKSPLYDLDGSVMGTVCVADDITRERAYEQALTEKSQTLEMLFSTMDCGVIYHSIDGKKIISINRAALRLLGYESLDEMLEDGFDMFARTIAEEDQLRLRSLVKNLKKPGDSVSAEYRVWHHKEGKLLHILGNIKIVEENGELFYQRFLLDFTAQKLQEEEKWAKKDQELKYQERLFEIFSNFLADNVDDVYIMLDEKCEKIDFISTNMDRVLGISPEELSSGVELLGNATFLTGKQPSRRDLADLKPGMSLEAMETERINPRTGEHKWFLESVHCVSVQNSTKIIAYISDRTKERKAQDALAEALEMAQVANKAKSTFLSNVSHDIRTPMNAILGFVALLKEEANDPGHVLEYTQKISAASQHLLGLVNDVLDMNKIESGSAVLNIGEFDLADVIEELNAIIRPQARLKEQEFELFTSSLTCEHLLGDKLRINQILINILSNAVKYTHNGGRIEMRVDELPQVDKKYSRVRFTISDNGQGMSEEYQKVLFDPFTREQETMTNKIQGTGLGMTITKSLVDMMNGSITVSSKLGHGSTFSVELELRIQETEDDPKFWERNNVVRMFVADDDEDICRDIVKKMTGSGVTAHYATSGTEAVERIRTAQERGEPYDLILLDWIMPDPDGLETARLIRQNCSGKIPIMIFTAYDWSEIEKDAQKAGIEYFLPKPFFMTNFKEAVQRMMGTDKVPPAPAEKRSAVDGKYVLVVDDIDVNRLILGKIMGTLGAKCDMATNGLEAVEKFESSKQGEYDLILMDIQMPLMNGYEAARAIRASAHPSANEVAIIAITANAFVDDIREALESGMDAHMAKPIVLDVLKRTIQEVFERRGRLT